MANKAGRIVAIAIGTVMLCALAACSNQPQPQEEAVPVLEVRDRPLLTEAQSAEARATGRVAFEAAGIQYVVAGLPDEWIGD